MADSAEATPPAAAANDQPVLENEENEKLKYLDFVRVAAIYVLVCSSTIYEYAKDNSGPLRSGVETVQGAVRTAIGPVYRKFHGVPLQLLQFLDAKLDGWIIVLDHHMPPILKEVSRRAWAATQVAAEVAGDLASEAERNGLVETAKTAYQKYEPAAKELYDKYETIAEQHAVVAWRSLNRLPLFSQVAHIMIPTAAYWAEKYNRSVGYMAERGYTVSYYLPLVPIDRIAKIFQGGMETETEPPAPEPLAAANGPRSQQ